MGVANLIQSDDLKGCPFPFLDDTPKRYKVYNDGRHLIATPCRHAQAPAVKPARKSNRRRRSKEYTDEQKEMVYNRIMRDKRRDYERGKRTAAMRIDISSDKGFGGTRSALDILFDDLFMQAYNKGLRDRKIEKHMTDYIHDGLRSLFTEEEIAEVNITERIKRKLNNLHHRKKRFRRKAYLNKWNFFVTFTYDDKKHDEETFRRKLRRCLSNLHTRRGWRYMGVFERAPETGRLHFHGLLYVPDGEMLGKLEEKTDYSTAQGKMQTRNENSFFERQYGRNDFEEITPSQLEYGDSVDYILKYIGKTNERIVYSRGIPTELCVTLTAKDILTELTNDFVLKYVIFDDVVDWERDILRYRFSKQMSITDLLCNPSLVA